MSIEMLYGVRWSRMECLEEGDGGNAPTVRLRQLPPATHYTELGSPTTGISIAFDPPSPQNMEVSQKKVPRACQRCRRQKLKVCMPSPSISRGRIEANGPVRHPTAMHTLCPSQNRLCFIHRNPLESVRAVQNKLP
jgi:hypothetical protein